jgi:AcrR family transcriptional regulator
MSIKSPLEQADLRVRRTHKLLWEALMAELSERTIEEITVSDICERAMVHRTTFYKHYEDKYALLEQGIRQMYDDLLAEEEHAAPSTYSVEHPPPYFIRLFEHAAHHQRFYRLMVCGEGIGRFQKLVMEYITEVVSAKVHELSPDNQQFAVPIDMHAHFVSGAALSLLAWWLEHDMPFTPHQMAQYLLSPHGTLASPS